MRFRALLIPSLLLIALAPSSALAQQQRQGDGHEEDVLIRINGQLNLNENQTAGTVIVISNDANIAGEVTEGLIVIDGKATLSGSVDGDLHLYDSLYDSEFSRAAGSTIEGSTHERSAATWSTWDVLALSAFVWAAMAILAVVVALLFAAAGGRQLVTSAGYITERAGATVLAALICGIMIPVLAVIAFLSVFGIPVELGLLVLLMPIMAGLGYIVAGTRIGLWLAARDRDPATIQHPYLAAVLGVVVLHVVGLAAFLGGMIQIAAAVLGAGSLTLLAGNAWRRRDTAQSPPAAPMQEEPAPAG